MLENKLFNITKEQEELSRKLFGRIVKCVVAPNHTYDQIVAMVSNTYIQVFPERDISKVETRHFISNTLKEGEGARGNGDIFIVTSEINIIIDIPGELVRVLDLEDKLQDCPIKTFHSNIIDIVVELFHNSNFSNIDESKQFSDSQLSSAIIKIKKADEEERHLSPEEEEEVQHILDILGNDYLLANIQEYMKRKEM
jgi:hypothetical protein